MKCEGTEVEHEDFPDMSVKEIMQYINIIKTDEGIKPCKLILKAAGHAEDGEELIEMEYTLPAQKFERIRRITGYLVGTVDRFNDAKRAEVQDRVKHQ